MDQEPRARRGDRQCLARMKFLSFAERMMPFITQFRPVVAACLPCLACPATILYETAMKKFARAFTLIELMIVVAVIGILMAIALPNYNEYVLKGKLTEAMTVLSDLQVRQEAYYADNRAYTAMNPRPGQVQYFDATACALRAGNNQTYDCTARSTALSYTYTINETGAKTTIKPDTTSAPCWLKSPKGSC